ncbi:MAG: hypothetical protein KJO42_02350 [Silicimonas sp.]|nr:hypothetical protein [Silicimonas sp.]NNF92334.1 hypothetical protein [Boseongicola sp.]RZW06576.1 MAG: hypothetical protein EX266_07380 [Paracoccaceae bacterium]MBT8425960.1 hypothetical protein [Silicimonas sp.]NND19846.1 hypothetical protein [Silicimonas sp.]
MNGKVSLRAMAQPIASTSERDIMIRGRHGKRSMYSLGLRDDGRAAFNVQTSGAKDDTVKRQTRIGACHGFETLIKRWLPS